jgi:phosphatidylserine/phosphatidylglycerophosphate/cardiolipin synthase-like enzyme
MFLSIWFLALASPNVAAEPYNDVKPAEVLGVYFTPHANAAIAIVKAIDACERGVLVQAYGFTHNAITQALIRAHQRGMLLQPKTQRIFWSCGRLIWLISTGPNG